MQYFFSVLMAVLFLTSELSAQYSLGESEEDALYRLKLNKIYHLKLKHLEKQIANDSIVGIELITLKASLSIKDPAQALGRTALRFVSRDDFKNDIVLSFEMLNLDPSQTLLKVADSSNLMVPELSTFLDFLSKNMLSKNLKVYRVPILTTSRQRQLAVEKIKILLESYYLLGNFHILENNSAHGVLKFLNMLDIFVKFTTRVNPQILEDILKSSGVILEESECLFEFESSFQLLKNQYQDIYKKSPVLNVDESTDSFFQFLLSSPNKDYVYRLLYFWPMKMRQYSDFKFYLLNAFMKQYGENTSFNLVPRYSKIYYQVCDVSDLECRNSRLAAMKSRGQDFIRQKHNSLKYFIFLKSSEEKRVKFFYTDSQNEWFTSFLNSSHFKDVELFARELSTLI